MPGGLREALLRQDGIEPDALSAREREKAGRVLARERAGIRWLKWGTAAGWILAILAFFPWADAYFAPIPNLNPALAQAAQPGSLKVLVLRIVLPIEAAASSLWLYLRTRRLGRRQVAAALSACEAELQMMSGAPGVMRPAPRNSAG